MNLFETEKQHAKAIWLLALLLVFSTTMWAQTLSVPDVFRTRRGNYL